MKVTLIRPNMFPTRSRDAMEPLSFAILKSLTPSDIECVLYDERLEPIPFDEPTDLVALTVETYTAKRAYQVASNYRERGIPVVMGGYHPTFLPEEALQYATSVVCGDAEGAWEEILEDARYGQLKEIYRQPNAHSLSGLQPDRSIFRGKRYAPITLVQYSRGCKYNCSFCSIRAFYGNNLRQRPVEDVVDEIKRVGRRHVFLVDDNVFVDIPKAVELFEALIPLNIVWSCQVSIDVTANAELLELMKRSGCLSAVVGLESLDRDNLKQMNKSWNLRYGDYESSIAKLREAGIMIYGTFIFGYDHDTTRSFDEAVQFAIRNRFYLANFNPLTPTPKAPLYDQLQQENRLIYDRWWLDDRFRYGAATFHPRQMTADELTTGCFYARKSFNRLRSIASRVWDRKTNLRTPYRLGVYALSNFISRKEIHRKQGMKLGGLEPLRPVSRPTESIRTKAS